MKKERDIKVSVCCITFNQEQYIIKALESFISQQANFDYEIIVCDDNSTDSTETVIKDFIKLNPEFDIKYIKNKINIGANRNLKKCFDIAIGDYIAVCEGDDYWCNDQKLQMQFDALNANDNCNLCVTSAYCVNDKGNCSGNLIPSSVNGKSDIGQVLSSSWQFAATATYFFRSDSIKELPSWFDDASIGDAYLELVFGRKGIIVLDEFTACYRTNAENWSSRVKKLKVHKVIEHYDNYIESLEKIAQSHPKFSIFKKEFISKINQIRVSKANFYLKKFYFRDYFTEYKLVAYDDSMNLARKTQYIMMKAITWL
ncbi:glycosyltransferase family 2 protein [Vibrio harveyi]